MNFLMAFLVGGLICLVGQILMDVLKLLPVHITTLFVLIGSVLEPTGLYDKLVEISGAGALLPISSFGHTMTHSALEASNYLELLGNIFKNVSAGISVAVVIALVCSLIFKPKG